MDETDSKTDSKHTRGERARERAKRAQERQRAKTVAKTQASVRQAREKLLAQHRELAATRERNRAENDDHDSATVPAVDTNEEVLAGRHSTVPPQPRESSVPPARRIYGLRFVDGTSSRQ